ncbi:MAG: hypothetical protein JSW11_05300 [Candidatus Heimdallarchaeota archaeon]|nr:MAG: hypothetical protein JSW11_05300 [Candidatus Heimdallarchaeota archaeon]
MEVSPPSDKLKFDPSLQEQLLLPKVHDHNLLVIYSSEEALIRIQSLIILFYLTQSDPQPSRILILTKKNQQQKFQTILKAHLTQLSTILNGTILPYARKFDYNRFRVIFSTARTTKNDLIEGFFPHDHFSLIIVNHAEGGSSSSSLRYLVNHLTNFRVVGFTQVTNSDRLRSVCKNLHFQEVVQLEEPVTHLEKSHIQHYSIPLPQEYFFILEILDQIKSHELDELEKLGFDVSSRSAYREITAIHESLKKDNNPKALIRVSNLLRIMVLQKIVISQGFLAVQNYFKALQSRVEQEQDFPGKRTIFEFLTDMKILKLREFISIHKDLQHPKVQMLLKLISQYKTGISIVSHNYHNSAFLKDYLGQQGFSVIQIEEPISSLTDLNLQRALLPFTEKKVSICITNTVHELIARNALVIIAYDVNAGIVESLNSIDVDIPRVFLLAKQTNEEARFFYLKRLGSRPLHQIEKLDSINESLPSNSRSQTRNKDDGDSPKIEKHDSPSLVFNSSLFEVGIPYLFSKKNYTIQSSNEISFPGFILGKKVCFLILLPDSVDFFLSAKPSQLFSMLINEFTQIHLIFFSHSFTNLSFDYQCELLHTANRHNVWISFLTKEEDLSKLVKRVLTNSIYEGLS